jgi:predicted transcriptional regulator
MKSSRPEDFGFTSAQKINPANSKKYAPLVMSDDAVFRMASHWYTIDEVAETFSVTRDTVMNLHGEAYRAGKQDGKELPRMMLKKIISDFDNEEINFARPDVPVANLLKAIELRARIAKELEPKTSVTINQTPESVIRTLSDDELKARLTKQLLGG